MNYMYQKNNVSNQKTKERRVRKRKHFYKNKLKTNKKKFIKLSS